MTNLERKGILAMLVFGSLMATGRAHAQDPSDATIVLHAVNYAALSPAVLDVAKARVAKIYDGIGVRIVWVDGESSLEQRQDRRLPLSIRLLSREMAEKKISGKRIEDGVLGQAHVSARRASIFWDRIAGAPGAVLHFSISLGDIIAHEVGHLLLGANSHSRSGIMSANIDTRALQLQSFNDAQARTITTTLNQGPRLTVRCAADLNGDAC